MSVNRTLVGSQGEKRAERYLKDKGWKILSRNFRTKRGELDIIAEDRDWLVFLEVKTWKTMPLESLEYSINWKKKKKIIMVSREYLAGHEELENHKIRYDVIFQGGNGFFEHYKDVFAETGQI